MLSPEGLCSLRRCLMPQAIALPLREQIVILCQQGMQRTKIARQLGLSYGAVRRCWQRFCTEGARGLSPHYGQCGRQERRYPVPLQQTALTLKRDHPRWGAGLIRVELRQQFPKDRLPSVRSLQRWFAAAGLQPVRSQRPVCVSPRAKQVHEVWELDAKERMRLADGTPTCVLNVTDEASGALLDAQVFPPVPL